MGVIKGNHAGQIALPGGRREEEDRDDVETALREAKEEIGLDPSLVEVVTALEPFEGEVSNEVKFSNCTSFREAAI